MRSVQLPNAPWITLFVPLFTRRQVLPDHRRLLENPKTHHRPGCTGVQEGEQVEISVVLGIPTIKKSHRFP